MTEEAMFGRNLDGEGWVGTRMRAAIPMEREAAEERFSVETMM